MKPPKVLVVDDGDRYVELFHALLRGYDYATRCELDGPCWECPRREGCTLTHAHDWAETQQALARHRDVDVVLLDVAFDIPVERLLPRGDDEATRRREQGLAILERLRSRHPGLPVVLMTSAAELGLESAAPLQADEYVTLAGSDAFDARALGLLVERILARSRETPTTGDGYVWGTSRAMERVRRDATTLARTSLPILLLGETGTGKSALTERVIHPASERGGRFVSVDLSALPESLVASELFGSTRGAFSGATDRQGRFEEADGGTLFLDEVGNLPLEVQRLLLLVLQEGRVTRLGENRARPVDVKLVAATHVDLESAVKEGRFRADLYARLNPAARLTLPPLRARRGDLKPLMQGFVERLFAAPGADRRLLEQAFEALDIKGPLRAELQVGDGATGQGGQGIVFVFAHAVFAQMETHAWPGNVRELELLVATSVLMALSDAVEAARAGRAAPLEHAIPIPAKLVRELLQGSWVQPRVHETRTAALPPRAQLRDVARELERTHFARLFRELEGDFVKMAARLLEGDPTANAKRVRLRFNQLGLSARAMKTVEE